MTPLFSVDCSCGRKVVIDSDTMRKVETVDAPMLNTSAHVLGKRYPGCPCVHCFAESKTAPSRRVSLVDEYTLGDWDGGENPPIEATTLTRAAVESVRVATNTDCPTDWDGGDSAA